MYAVQCCTALWHCQCVPVRTCTSTSTLQQRGSRPSTPTSSHARLCICTKGRRTRRHERSWCRNDRKGQDFLHVQHWHLKLGSTWMVMAAHLAQQTQRESCPAAVAPAGKEVSKQRGTLWVCWCSADELPHASKLWWGRQANKEELLNIGRAALHRTPAEHRAGLSSTGLQDSNDSNIYVLSSCAVAPAWAAAATAPGLPPHLWAGEQDEVEGLHHGCCKWEV